tara:strand:+ start:8058 stop:8684 length:627 start_codon:yes stop_codon:yes gene_type:complete
MIKIDVISDTICPWCFIGKRNFEKAISQVPGIEVKFSYSTFQLNPNFPKEGVDKKEYISRKFNNDHYSNMKERIKDEAIKSGISISNNTLTIIPNTFNSHKLILWSKEYDCHTEIVENLFKAYFEDSKDISNVDILLEIAENSGMDKRIIKQKFLDDLDNEIIIEEERKNRENGVMGVPTYIINDGITLTGSQPVDSLVRLLEHINSD